MFTKFHALSIVFREITIYAYNFAILKSILFLNMLPSIQFQIRKK